MNYSEVQLTKLAQDNPAYLSKLLSNPYTKVNVLTFGIEILSSETKDEKLFLEPVKILLKHVNALVRESACIALSSFYIDKVPPQEIVDKLKSLLENDPSINVKNCIEIFLKDISKI